MHDFLHRNIVYGGALTIPCGLEINGYHHKCLYGKRTCIANLHTRMYVCVLCVYASHGEKFARKENICAKLIIEFEVFNKL